jgi:hypothetical protein
VTTAADTELDQATLDELAPACDLPRDGVACPNPADWIVWAESPFIDDAPKLLICDDHLQTALAHRAACGICKTFSVLHTERLR